MTALVAVVMTRFRKLWMAFFSESVSQSWLRWSSLVRGSPAFDRLTGSFELANQQLFQLFIKAVIFVH